MAIRDKFRRAVGARTSTTSTGSASSNHAEASAAAAANGSSSTSSSSASAAADSSSSKNRSRTFTWRSGKTAEEKEQQKKNRKKNASSDPREKPFTEMNLRYQEILGSYELTFGTTHPEQLWNPDGELSPGTSRQNSIDLSRH